MVRKLSLALVAVLILTFAASAQVVINELVYDPVGVEESGEWVELYNAGTSSVNLTGWQITDQDTHTYTFPSGATIAVGGYVVVHTGAGTNTSTAFYAGFTSGIWNNDGDEVLLENGSGTGVDYIQYDGGSGGDSPPSELTWAGDIPGTSEGNSIALMPDGNDQDDATNWIPRSGSYITQGSANAPQPNPTVTVDITYPTGKTYVSTCEEAQAMITVTNNDSTASIYNVSVKATLPSDFYYVSDNHGGTYNSNDHTITWSGLEITAGDSWLATITFQPSCSASTNQAISADVTWASYSGGASNTVPTVDSDLIDVEPVVIGITKLVYNESAGETEGNADVITHAALEDIVVFVIQVVNNGDGDAVDGVEIQDELGAGLTFVSLKHEGGSDVVYTGNGIVGDPYTWNTGVIDHGTAKKYYLTATVTSCEELTNQATYTYGCADQSGTPSCESSDYASASIALILKEPDVSYTVVPSPITIDYCSGGTVSVTVVNGDPAPASPDLNVGTAHGFTLTMGGLPTDYQVTNFQTASYVSGVFTVGDIDANTQVTFTFDLAVDNGACSPATSGTLLFTPYYENDCGKGYALPVTLDSFSLTGRPSISITKTGQRAVDVGEIGISYTLAVHYEGPNGQTFTITDDYPDAGDTASGWGNFTVTDPAGGTDDEGKIKWTPTFNNDDNWTKTIVLNAPTDPCAGGNTYTNTLFISPTNILDCKNCTIPITDNVSFEIYVNNNTEEAITEHHKTVTYVNKNSNGVVTVTGSAEDCTDIQYTTSVTFNTGIAAPQTWSGIVFRDDMNGGQTYVSLDAVKVNGTGYTGAVPNTSGYLEIDLSYLDGVGAPQPKSGAKLEITYTFRAPDGSEGSFIDWSHLTVPGFGVTCGTDARYNQGVDVSIGESSLGISLSGPQIIDKCEIDTYTIDICKGDFQGYDALVTFDTEGHYTYVSNSTVFSGFTDESGSVIALFEPTVSGNDLSWDLGDLSTAGTIQIDLCKCCSPEDTSYSATVAYNDNCDNQTDGIPVIIREGSSSTSGAAGYLAKGYLHIVIEPSSYFTVSGYPQFKVYLLNTGDGAAYNADLTLTFNGLVYDSYTSSEAAPASFTGSSGDTSVVWHYDEIPAGQKSVLTVTGEITGCDLPAWVDGSAIWGCSSQTTQCQSDLPVTDTMTLQFPSSDLVVVEHTMVPGLVDYCGDPVTFTITAKNYGPAMAYDPWLQETLANGLTYVAATAEYSLDGGSTWIAFPGGYTYYSGQTIKWNFVDPDNNGNTLDHLLSTTDDHENYVLASGETIAIRFKAKLTDCTAAATFASGTKHNDAQSNYDLPCNHTNTGDPGSSSPVNRLDLTGASPHVSITKWGKNGTSAYTTESVDAKPGDTVVWKVQIESDGDYRAKEISVQDVLPSNVTFSSWAPVPGESNVNLAFDSGDGTSGSPLAWHVDNSDYGLDVGQVSTIEITTTVDACTTPTTNTATVDWGCCTADKGSESDSVDLKTQLDPSDLAITVNTQNFSTCGGDVTIQITNNDSFHTAYHFHLKDALPTSGDINYAWVYDSSNGGAKITSSDVAHIFTESEEEPVLSPNDTVLEWMGADASGNIPSVDAYIAPGEILTITFHVKALGNFCDTSCANDGADPDVEVIPTDNNLVDLDYQDSCGSPLSLSQVTTSVDPVQPDVDIVSVVATPPLGMTGDTVHWTITLRNDGDGTASNVTLQSIFGNGFNNTSVTSITPTGIWISGTNTVTWTGITLDAAESKTYEYDVTISGEGSLTNTATVTGECLDAAGTTICNHSYDQLVGQSAGVDFDKLITDIPAPGTIAGDANSGDASIGNVITYQIQVHYLGDGTYENTTITDELPAGLEFVDQSLATIPAVDVAFAENTNTLTWTVGTGTPPSFTDDLDVTITVRALVVDNAGNAPATDLMNIAYTDFTLNDVSYDHTDSAYGSKITESNTVTVIEPELAISKTSDDTDGIVDQGQIVTYTITLENNDSTGIAYDPVVTDVVPQELRDPDPIINSVVLNGTTLTASNYDYSYNSSTGEMIFSFTHSGYDAISPSSDVVIVYHVTVPADIGAGRTGSRALINDANATAYSLPVGTNDSGRREYTAGPAQVPLSTANAEITKSQSPADGLTVDLADSVTYTLTLPDPAIAVTLYDVSVVDTVPDGLSVTSVILTGGQTPSSTFSGRIVTVTFSQIDPSAQATVTIICSVNAKFDNGSDIQPGHAFANQATLDWYDAPSADPNRRDHVATSNTVTAYFQGAAITLTPDHMSDTFPGSMVSYRHTLENLGSEDDIVTLTYGPSSQGWSWILYLGDGNGNITSGPIVSGSAVGITAGASQELIMRAFVPADTPNGTTDVVELTAQGANNADSVTDITIVRQGKMRLVKEESVDGGTAWHTSVQAQPGDTAIFRLTFTNIGTETLFNIRVIDSIPDNTVYVTGSAASGNDGTYTVYYSTDGGVSWTMTEPAAGDVTHIRWNYVGTLAPGESHYVTYEVSVK